VKIVIDAWPLGLFLFGGFCWCREEALLRTIDAILSYELLDLVVNFGAQGSELFAEASISWVHVVFDTIDEM
jgi:hypothetical protein